MAYHDYSLDQLLDLLQTQTAVQGRAAADALGQRGSVAIEPLLHILHEEEPQSIRASWAIEALIRVGLPAVNPLLDLLREDNRWIRLRAIYMLGRIGDRRAVRPLLDTLQSDDPLVRKYSAAALGDLGDERAIGPLIDRLVDSNRDVVHDVDEALVALGEPVVLPLITILEDRQRATMARTQAASILGKLRDERALGLLTVALLDRTEASVVREVAAESLSNVDERRGLDSLVRVATQRAEEPKVRISVIQSVRDQAAFAMLLGILRDIENEGAVRAAAAGQLCVLGGRRAVGVLIDALDDPDATVRHATVTALGACGDARVLPALEQAVQRDASLEWVVQRARTAIARRLSLPFTTDDDPAGKLVACHGPISIYEVKEDPKPHIRGQMLYIIRLNDPEGNVDLDKLALVTPGDRENVLNYLRRTLERLGKDAMRLTQRLREARDSVDIDQLGERLARIDRQGRALEYTMRELEGEY